MGQTSSSGELGASAGLGLTFQINVDESAGAAALDAFRGKLSAVEQHAVNMAVSFGDVEDKFTSSQAAADAFANQVTQSMGQQVPIALEKVHQNMRLIEAAIGFRLPRAVTTAVSEMVPSLATLGQAFLAAYGIRELAEALDDWDAFKQKVFDLVAPVTNLEVKIANLFGLLLGYSKEEREQSEQGKKDSEDAAKLAERVLKAQNALTLSKLEGIPKIREETRQQVQQLTEELSKTDQVNRSYYQHLIDVAKATGLQREHAEAVRHSQEAEARLAASMEEEARWEEKVITTDIHGTVEWDEAHLRLLDSIKMVNKDLRYEQAEVKALTIAFSNLGRVNRGEVLDLTPQIVASEGTKHLTAGRRELLAITQNLRDAEYGLTDAFKAGNAQVQVDVVALGKQVIPGLEQMSQGLIQAGLSAAIHGQSVGKAMKQAAAATLESLAVEAAWRALMATAVGFYDLATYNYPGAEAAFEAAGIFGAVAAGAGVAGAALSKGSGGSAGGGSNGNSGGSGGSSSGSGSGSAASGPGWGWNLEGPHSQTASPTINLHINGQQFASVVVPVISQGVQNGTVHLVANTTVV